MACTTQQVLADAKQLVTRLLEHESSADNLIKRSQQLDMRVGQMRKYNEEISSVVNAETAVIANPPIIMGIQHENTHVCKLQQENRDLRLALEDHQSVMGLIMHKYRQQAQKMSTLNRMEESTASRFPDKQLQALQDKAYQVQEMAAVMHEAARLEDTCSTKQLELISSLQKENEGLREVLGRTCNSCQLFKPAISTAEKDTQTSMTEVCTTPTQTEPEKSITAAGKPGKDDPRKQMKLKAMNLKLPAVKANGKGSKATSKADEKAVTKSRPETTPAKSVVNKPAKAVRLASPDKSEKSSRGSKLAGSKTPTNTTKKLSSPEKGRVTPSTASGSKLPNGKFPKTSPSMEEKSAKVPLKKRQSLNTSAKSTSDRKNSTEKNRVVKASTPRPATAPPSNRSPEKSAGSKSPTKTKP